MKKCPKCLENKPTNEFYKDKQTSSGFSVYCKKCKNKKNQIWASKNKDKMVTRIKKWQAANRKTLASNTRKWQANHPGYVFERNHLRRAKDAGSPGEITAEDWEKLCRRYGNKCLCCGKSNVKLTLDHVIPLKHGGLNIIENAQPLCISCNCSKQDKHTDYRTT